MINLRKLSLIEPTLKKNDNIIGNLINKVLDVKPLVLFIIKIMPLV